MSSLQSGVGPVRQLAPSSLTAELLASGIPQEYHSRLGYRRVTKSEAKELTGHDLQGWVVPMNDPRGKPYDANGRAFFRLKPDPGQKQRNGKEPGKYLTPGGAGCRPYYSPLLKDEDLKSGKPKRITEGEKKADCLNAHGRLCIALSGVDSWRDKRGGESQPLPELEEVNWAGSDVFVVYDSDVAVKPSVAAAMERLCTWLVEQGANPRIVLLPCEPDGSKNGVDDFIARHGIDAYDHLERIARPAFTYKGKTGTFWSPEPTEPHHYALTAFTVFQGTYAHRPGLGLYKWTGTYWKRLAERPNDAISAPLHWWMDQMGWSKRAYRFNAIRDELVIRLKASDWAPSHLTAFTNGTLNTTTGEFKTVHEPSDHLTFCFPFPYDKGAKCPKWEEFLQGTFGGHSDVINLLRAAFRWSVAPKDTTKPFPYEVSFDVHGPRGCGKGTMSEVLQAICGKEGVGVAKSQAFNNPNSLASLVGKRIAIDTDASGHITDAGRFNSVVSNEPLETKVLYQDVSCHRLGVVIWRFFNDTPSASGGALEGMGRRIVTFRIEHAPAKRDTGLKERLLKEAAGIFQWCWSMSEQEMATAFETRGQIESVRQSTIENLLESQPVLRFLIETYQDGCASIQAKDLYAAFKAWTSDSGIQSFSRTRFGREAKKVAGVVSSERGVGTFYKIAPMSQFNEADHFGFGAAGGEFNPPQQATHHANPPHPKPLQCKDSRDPVVSVVGLLPTFVEERKKEENDFIERSLPFNPPHSPHPPQSTNPKPGGASLFTVASRVEAAQAEGCRTLEEIASWAARKGLSLARTEIERTIKRQGGATKSNASLSSFGQAA